MVKLLVVGSICGEWSLFQKKISSLHSSAHGPFDLCLCTGSFFQSSEEYAAITPTLILPLPTYVIDNTGLPNDDISLIPNLHLLPSMGSTTVCGLNVACMGRGMKQVAPGAFERLAQSPQEVMYFKGYDVLLTADWPEHVRCARSATCTHLPYPPNLSAILAMVRPPPRPCQLERPP